MYTAYTVKGGVAITPSDTLTVSQQMAAAGKPGQSPQRLWVGGAGNLTLTMESGDILTFYAVQGYLELRFLQVWNSAAAAQAAATANGQTSTAAIGATTATNILALY